MSAAKFEGLALVGVAVVGLVLVSKYLPGLWSGDNALTRDAKDSAGNAVTAYQGAGVLGTAGAAANMASGGYLATFGDWLGTQAAWLTNPVLTDANRIADKSNPESGIDWRLFGN